MSRSAQTPTTSTNGGPDVRQLDGESLSSISFPAPRTALFRVHFDSKSYSGMIAHASEDTSFEICGVLVGEWGRDPDGPFVTIRNFIRCDNATKKFAEVTFTHESWSHINSEMDTKFQDQRIVGWYHSHPNFGIFLSDRDLFIQQNFFSGPGQIALVIDPVRKIEGVFEWREGSAVPSPHYWVDGRVVLAAAGSDVKGLPETGMDSLSPRSHAVYPALVEQTSSPLQNATLMILSGMCLFLIGWTLSGWRTDWDRRALIEGTVAHFGIWKGLRPGLEEAMIIIQRDLDGVAKQTKRLSADHLTRVKGDEKAEGQARQDWKKVLETMDDVRGYLKQVELAYALTPEERDALRRYVEQKLVEVSKGSSRTDESTTSDRKSTPDSSSAKSKDKSKTAREKKLPADTQNTDDAPKTP